MNKPYKIIFLLKKILSNLSQRRRAQLIFSILIMILSMLAEIISLGSVIPFIGILINPELVIENLYIQRIYKLLDIQNINQFKLLLIIFFIIIVISSSLFRLFLLWFNTKLAFACGADIGKEIFKKTLNQPYEAHINNSSTNVISTLITKVNLTVLSLNGFLQMLTSSVLIITISITLFVINPEITSILMLSLFTIYTLIILLFKANLSKYSSNFNVAQTKIVKIITESLGGIRDIILDNSQNIYTNEFSKFDSLSRKSEANIYIVSGAPRLLIEGFAITIIAIIAFISSNNNGVINILPTLGAIALGGQRVLPAIHHCYAGWASISGNRYSISEVISFLDQKIPSRLSEGDSKLLFLENELSLKNVSFSYDQKRQILSDIELLIKQGDKVGIVGSSGSGKSTFCDLLMGLLLPTKGKISIDNEQINSMNMSLWQKNIAHVPQSIFLLDETIKHNITLTSDKENINDSRLIKSCKASEILDFINENEKKMDTIIGERGIKLSGGQKQRIGIARALYKNPNFIIFDEATSSLDINTEKKVIKNIEKHFDDITMIFVAHRTSTLQNCDYILKLENAMIVKYPTYQSYIETIS